MSIENRYSWHLSEWASRLSRNVTSIYIVRCSGCSMVWLCFITPGLGERTFDGDLVVPYFRSSRCRVSQHSNFCENGPLGLSRSYATEASSRFRNELQSMSTSQEEQGHQHLHVWSILGIRIMFCSLRRQGTSCSPAFRNNPSTRILTRACPISITDWETVRDRSSSAWPSTICVSELHLYVSSWRVVTEKRHNNIVRALFFESACHGQWIDSAHVVRN